MHKILTGIVVSVGMKDTIVVEVTEQKRHPIYRKLLKRSKRFKADSTGKTVSLGDKVAIVETRPLARDKHFKLERLVTAKKVARTKEKKA